MLSRVWSLGRARSNSAGRLVVAADFGARRIKIAAVAAEDGPPDLSWAVDIPTPTGIFGAEGQFDAVAAGRVLGQLMASGPVHPPVRGAVLLPGVAVRVRRLQTAAADQAALKRVLVDDSELRVPGVSVEGLHHAVSALRDTPPDARGDAGRSLVAAAARRDVIRAYSAAGAAGEIDPLRVSAPAVALANLHRVVHPGETAEPVLLVHVGSVRTELVVVHGGAPLLSLPLVQGVDQLFDAIRASSADVEPDVLLRESAPAVPALDEWVSRVRGSHRTAVGAAERHLRRTLQDLPVRLSGGIARYGVVVERLAAAVPAPVGVLDPAERFPHAASADVFAPALVLALGAALEAREVALREAAADGALPPELVALDLAVADGAPTSRSFRPALLALARDRGVWFALLLAAVLALVIPWWMESGLERRERELVEARAEHTRDAAAVASDSLRISALQADSVRLAGTLGTLATLEAHRYAWPKLMYASAASLPAYAWLEGVEMETGETGAGSRFFVSAVAPTQADVSRFERVLRGSGEVAETRLESSESLAAGPFALVGFRISGLLVLARPGGDQPQPEGAGYNEGPQEAPAATDAP